MATPKNAKRRSKTRIIHLDKVNLIPHEMTLGCDYQVRLSWRREWTVCRFVKVTRKGFNLLNLETSKCVVRNSHIYDRTWVGRDIPDDRKKFTVWIPSHFAIGGKVSASDIG
jgi:hypothetical protein